MLGETEPNPRAARVSHWGKIKGFCFHRESNRDYVLNCGLQVCRSLIFGKKTKGQFGANGAAEGRLVEQNINAWGC